MFANTQMMGVDAGPRVAPLPEKPKAAPGPQDLLGNDFLKSLVNTGAGMFSGGVFGGHPNQMPAQPAPKTGSGSPLLDILAACGQGTSRP